MHARKGAAKLLHTQHHSPRVAFSGWVNMGNLAANHELDQLGLSECRRVQLSFPARISGDDSCAHTLAVAQHGDTICERKDFLETM